jgi:STE24 endopeptidase
MTAQIVFFIIIGIIVFDFLLERILQFLNDKNWKTDIPSELTGFFDADKAKKAFAYHRTQDRFGMITSCFSFVLILVFLYFSGFAWVDGIARSYTEHPILVALLFFGLIGLASDILGIPFALYKIFVIEEKFGFNKMTIKTFIGDKIKGYILGAILGGGLLSAIVWFYEKTGDNFWLWAWGIVVAFLIFITMFYASLIVPIFNKLEPLKEGELQQCNEKK